MDMTNAAIFAKVVESRGFSAAGRSLGIPKTTVSRKIAALEAELGIRLLNRTTRKLALTEAGSRIYEHCSAAVQHMEEADREARALQSVPLGMLTIAAPDAFGVPFLLPAINVFMEHYPTIQVTLLSENRLVSLEDNHVDVVIQVGGPLPTAHTVRLLADINIGLYASKGYLAAYSMPTEPRELVDHRAVAPTRAFINNRFVWRLIRGPETVEVSPHEHPNFRSNDPMAIFARTIAGQGIAPLPQRLVKEVDVAKALIPILPEWRLPPTELNALLRDASSLKTRLFSSFIVDWFRQT